MCIEHPCVLLQWLNKTVTTAFQNRHSGNNEPKHEFYQIGINQDIVVNLRLEWCPLGFKIQEVFASFGLMQLSICSSNLVYRILLDLIIWNRCSSHKFCFFAFDYLTLLDNWSIRQHLSWTFSNLAIFKKMLLLQYGLLENQLVITACRGFALSPRPILCI